MRNFFVVWVAQRQNGTIAAPVESFTEKRAAVACYHLRCSNAANGDNIKDTVMLFTSDGFVLEQEIFENAPTGA